MSTRKRFDEYLIKVLLSLLGPERLASLVDGVAQDNAQRDPRKAEKYRALAEWLRTKKER